MNLLPQCRSRARAFTFLALAFLIPSAVSAQQLTKTPRPRGEVTGLELSLEGATTVPRGGTLRWFFTLYEVVGHHELRLARGGHIRVLTSYQPDSAISELRTDRNGRAHVAFTAAAPGSFQVIVEAASGRVTRTFTTSVALEESSRIELIADRSVAQPGETVALVGRVMSAVTARPVANQQVTIDILDQDGRSATPSVQLETGRSGSFITNVVVPSSAQRLNVSARSDGVGSLTASIAIATPAAPRMIARAVPLQRLIAPGARVPVDVMVRRVDGRPVEGARLNLGASEAWTNAAGRARLHWIAPDLVAGEPIRDLVEVVRVHRGGLGDADAEFTVRVAREERLVGVSVEGGSLIPNVPSRIYVRVVNNDGQPARGVPVQLESLPLGQVRGVTDEAGVARLETRPIFPPGIEGRDRCGGATASSTLIVVGEHNDELRMERCLPVDNDAAVRVRPLRPVVDARTEIELDLSVASRASRRPLEVMLLKQHDDRLYPVLRQLVPDGERHTTLALPDDIVGEVVVRVRPLVGHALEPARGGTALVWVTPGPRHSVSIDESDDGVILRSSTNQEGEGTLLVVPAQEAEELIDRIQRAMLPTFDQLLGHPSEAPLSLIEGWLAARAPRDDGAPIVLRNNEMVVMPALDSPELVGVLRDPIRARSRYIRGRLALVVRTLERRLAEAIPDRVSDVGVHTGRGWVFNREALRAVIGAHLLTGRVPMTLGGDELTLEDLESIDSSFTFDNMARRITRERLLSLLINIRNFARGRELDLWQPVGDPNNWLQLIIEEGGFDEGLLHDGWGRPMRIRRAPGGRARFTFLTPLPAEYELVSAGPDGRFGTNDDIYDPFAQVLPSGSAYSEAVAEDDLLARLRRVELSQATLAEVAQLCLTASRHEPEGAVATAARAWSDVPEMLVAIDGVDTFERSWLPVERGLASLSNLDAAHRRPIEVSDEPRSYAAIAVSSTAEGWVSVSHTLHRAGFPVLVTAPPLERLRVDEPLVLPLTIARLPGGPRDLFLSAEGEGVVQVQVEGDEDDGALGFGPGDVTEARVRLSSRETGRGLVRMTVRAGDRSEHHTVDIPIQVSSSGLLRSQSAATIATPQGETLPVELPRDASTAQGVVVLANPNAFLGDATLEPWQEQDPALLAWAMAVSGQNLPESLIRQLETATSSDGTVDGASSPLSTACASVAWAAATSGIPWAQQATASRVTTQHVDGSISPSDLSMTAALLTALSVAASQDDSSDLSEMINRLRDDLRRAARRRDRRGVLAKGAAALLLSDRRDIRGRTMFALARQHLEAGFRGGLAIRLDDESSDDVSGRAGREQLEATAALAIAAHQTGELELARQLGRGLVARAHIATALGGETLFWYLAARAFGVFGVDDTLEVTLVQGARRDTVQLGTEAITLPLDLPNPGRESTVRLTGSDQNDAFPIVRTVARYIRPTRPSLEGPLRAVLDGDGGFAGERAAYTVAVSNQGRRTVERSVLLVTLPAGARLDATALRTISRVGGVIDIDEADRRGVVRIRIGTMHTSGSHIIPLPITWSASGRRRGLSLAVFPEDRPWELSTTPELRVDVPFREDVEE